MANTAYSSALGLVQWEAESSFSDQDDDTVTYSIAVRDDVIDMSGLDRELIDPGGVQQRRNASDLYKVGAFGVGTFTMTLDLHGHGTTAVGALSVTDLGLLLGHVFGNSVWSQVGDSNLTAAASTASSLVGSDAATTLLGGLVRVGALNDGRAEGQFGVVGTTTGDNGDPLELDTELPGVVGDGDDLFACGMVYPGSDAAQTDVLTSDGSASNNTLRFILIGGGNLAYVCRGCACTGVELTGTNPGESPQLVLTWSTVAWEAVTATLPSATAISDFPSVPNSAGSVFIASATNAGVPTKTRATIQPMETAISLGHRVEPRFGPGGENNYQNVVGWHRLPAMTTVSYTVESEAQTASPAYQLTANPTTAAHSLITLSTVDGAALGLYFPRLIQTAMPTMGDWSGMRSRTITYRAATNVLTAANNGDELTNSAWRLGLC